MWLRSVPGQPAAPRVPGPPRHANRFRSDALDEVRAFVGRTDGEHSRIVHGTGPLRYALATLTGAKVVVGWTSVALAQTLRGAVRDPVLHVALDARGTYTFGRRQLVVAPGSAVFVPAGWEHTRCSGAGSLVGIKVDRAALNAEFAARRAGSAEAGTLDAGAFVPEGSDGRRIGPAIGSLIDELCSADDDASRAHGEARAISVLAGLALRASAVSAVTPLAAARLADVETWIDAHLADPITLGRLCEVSGVGERSLQLAFRSRRGLSPMRFVAERRLAVAHRLLGRAEAECDVTRVAVSVGFTHLGRFAATYRRAYGESPSQTLRR